MVKPSAPDKLPDVAASRVETYNETRSVRIEILDIEDPTLIKARILAKNAQEDNIFTSCVSAFKLLQAVKTKVDLDFYLKVG